MTPARQGLRGWILGFLRVPEEPSPPAGSVESLRVFRAGEAYARLLLWRWIAKQVLLVVAFAFWFAVVSRYLPETLPMRTDHGRTVTVIQVEDYRPWLLALEIAGFAFGLVQMPFTYTLMRLRYEQHWYMVTDRSLRIRDGITTVRESTLSFANIQNISVQQNPVQRLFGLADVEVRSAGGGGAAQASHDAAATADSWHMAVFRNVAEAEAIRDLIVERQRALKESGLGDLDEWPATASAAPEANPSHPAGSPDDLAAALELLAEVRRFREAVTGGEPR